MKDLVCVVADKNIEAAVSGLLDRTRALGIRAVDREVLVHPRRDPGCFHEASELLSGYRDRAGHALVIMDAAWEGAPAETGEELEQLLELEFRRHGLRGWARPVVIDPELEVWVFSNSPHVATILGWTSTKGGLRAAIEAESLWDPAEAKPRDPKQALQWVLRQARQPRSSAIYRELATRVGLRRCQDRSFLRLTQFLREWFPAAIESA